MGALSLSLCNPFKYMEEEEEEEERKKQQQQSKAQTPPQGPGKDYLPATLS